MTSWSISRHFSLVFAKPVRNFKIVCFLFFSLDKNDLLQHRYIPRTCFFFHRMLQGSLITFFLKGRHFVSTFERSSVCRRSVCWVEPIDPTIDRSIGCILAGRNARKKVASRKKNAIPKTGRRLAADLRGGRNYTGEWRDAFARGWKVSSGFRRKAFSLHSRK